MNLTLKTGALVQGLSGLALLCQAQVPAQLPPSLPNPPAEVRPVPTAMSQSQPESLPQPPRLSPWAKEILKLAQAGTAQSVINAFIDNAGVFALGADQIIYLADLGVSEETIERMLQHDRDLVSGATPPTIVSEPPYEPLHFILPNDRTVSTAAAPADPNRPRPSRMSIARAPDAAVALAGAPAVNPFENGAPYQAEAEAAAPSRTEVERAAPAATRRNAVRYPVREPQPVELLPPILFINAYEPQPNTLVIVGFPKS